MLAASGGWEAEMGYLKIVVKIPDTIYPELVADLQRVQLRDRAERLRLLAMLGLMHTQPPLQDGGRSSAESVPISESGSATQRMIKNLSDSL
jgi:hypothetical protein